MALTPTFPGDVDDAGKLTLAKTARRDLARYVKTLTGKRVRVTVTEEKAKRSDPANRWHWGVAIPLIANELGYDRHEHELVHYALVAKWGGTTFDPKLGVEVPNKRSSQLTPAEFSDLMEWEVRFAATDLGIVIPLPGEVA